MITESCHEKGSEQVAENSGVQEPGTEQRVRSAIYASLAMLARL
jgi:hypothetical protein